ncbi:5-histidylcysteine sulfoxide synthase [uncultured Endozoicomonas sp.]|uniref:5-histidylcysteine sulfoxide synthase n=1 Tax=uncultured Endozoicomonas sp. TaxID=432652 RepID=UPI00261855FF|nr:5-histidylcysteine sulfoxide synthase [uncultured Endozoicomonas sp.]
MDITASTLDNTRANTEAITRTPILNTGTPEAKRRELLNYFQATFDQYEQLFQTLAKEDAWFEKAIPLRHPLIFYYGHTAAFFVNKLMTAKLISERVDPYIESTVAIGVDEMSWDDLDDKNYRWPSVKQVHEYRQKVRAVVCDFIESMPIEMPIHWESPAWIILMGIEHERIHLETSSVLIRQLPISWVTANDDWAPCRKSDVAPDNRLIDVAGQSLKLGKDYDNELYGWDNEYGRFEVNVAPFKASEFLVSNQEFKTFMDAEGYDTERWWTDEGWAWATFSKTRHPEFWVSDGKNYRYRTMLEEIEMPWNWPVDVNCHEAQAFCRWKSEVSGKQIQLPSEAEWYCLRESIDTDQPYWNTAPGNINLEYWSSSCPVDRFRTGNFCDVIGNVWQWTGTPIDGYDGFRVHPCYDDFSTPTFDGRHNLIKGGSWISTGNYAIKDSRYAFRRHFFQHAGFRYVESTAVTDTSDNPYETDELVAQYLAFHFGEDYFNVTNYPHACAQICLEASKSTAQTRALDLGCSVGRTSFELARDFQHVDGIDFSARFISAAAELQEKGKVRYFIPTEGELGDYAVADITELGFDDIEMGRIRFTQGDACNLKPIYNDYDLIFAGNLIDRLNNPTQFLSTIHERLRPGGILVITSPYTWLEEYTPKKNWLGGIRENGEAVDTYTGLQRVLSEHFEEVQAPQDVPFVIRETARKYQHSVAQCTTWKKKE